MRFKYSHLQSVNLWSIHLRHLRQSTGFSCCVMLVNGLKAMGIKDRNMGKVINLVDMKDREMRVAMRIRIHARGKRKEMNQKRVRWCGWSGYRWRMN